MVLGVLVGVTFAGLIPPVVLIIVLLVDVVVWLVAGLGVSVLLELVIGDEAFPEHLPSLRGRCPTPQVPAKSARIQVRRLEVVQTEEFGERVRLAELVEHVEDILEVVAVASVPGQLNDGRGRAERFPVLVDVSAKFGLTM